MVKHTLAPVSAILAALTIGGCSGQSASGDAAPAPSTPLGVFAPVRGAPPAFASVTGSAELVAGRDGGSDASISLRGLRPNTDYVAHVHTGICDQPDPGGPHFKFDLDGPDAPPNEIHVAFTSNATGGASAQAHSARAVPDGAAGSIVVHEQQSAKAGAPAPPSAAPSAHEAHGGSNAARPGAGAGHSHAAKVACAALHAGAAPARSAAPAATGGAPLTIRVKADEPVGGVQALTVRKGDRVRFAVTADQVEDVHVHGYDLTRPVTPGTPAQLDFEAGIEGIFEVELERAGVQILSLTVNPR